MHFDDVKVLETKDKARILAACAVTAIVIALIDRLKVLEVPLGILYVVPLSGIAFVVPTWIVVCMSIAAAWLKEEFSITPWEGDVTARIAMSLLAFVGVSLFVSEMTRRRRIESASRQQLTEQIGLRQEAEKDARALVESSPAAILTVSSDGEIDLANQAAKRLLGLGSESVSGVRVADYFPILAQLLGSKSNVPLLRTMIEGNGRRADGDMFFAQMWLSSYTSGGGTKLVAVVADASEQLRDREELGLRQLLMHSKIIAGAVSHEIRNLAAAADVLHENIGKAGNLANNDDFEALGRLIAALRKLSAADVPANADQVLTGVDMNALLRQLKIILASSGDEDVQYRWEIADGLSRVRADQSGLLQVLLNLAQNSRRAVSERPDSTITIVAYQLGSSVVIRFADSGPGIETPEGLFRPFQPGATSAGLGLYISRAIVRTYGGELQYLRRMGEGCFLIELPAMASLEATIGD